MRSVPLSDPVGLLYTAEDPAGGYRLGWLCREDCPGYENLDAWHDALNELDGIKLLSVRRCRESEAQKLFAVSLASTV